MYLYGSATSYRVFDYFLKPCSLIMAGINADFLIRFDSDSQTPLDFGLLYFMLILLTYKRNVFSTNAVNYTCEYFRIIKTNNWVLMNY